MCHRGVFERALDVCASAPFACIGTSQIFPVQRARHEHFPSTVRGVQHSLSDEGFYHNIEEAIGVLFTIHRASFMHIQT